MRIGHLCFSIRHLHLDQRERYRESERRVICSRVLSEGGARSVQYLRTQVYMFLYRELGTREQKRNEYVTFLLHARVSMLNSARQSNTRLLDRS